MKYSHPVLCSTGIPFQLGKSYRQQQPLNGQLCDTYFLATAKNTTELLLIINKLKQTKEVICKSSHFYDCRNNTPFSDLYDRAVALKDNTACYATPVVH